MRIHNRIFVLFGQLRVEVIVSMWSDCVPVTAGILIFSREIDLNFIVFMI